MACWTRFFSAARDGRTKYEQEHRARRKRDRKTKGKTYKTVREKLYGQSRAPHTGRPPKNVGVARMLVRQHNADLLRIDCEGWHGEGKRDVCAATAIFRCGCTVHREAVIEYGDFERQDILTAVLGSKTPDRKLVAKADNIRKRRWLLREDLLGGMQREYHAGLPAHELHIGGNRVGA